ncbi:MAG: fluoride efflux transporter FluC [Acidimicrobiales bacterium]|jgi:CrcB protein
MNRAGRRRLAIAAAIAGGGMLGAVARYALMAAWPVTAGSFPWVTLVVNVSGSACLGFLLRYIGERLPRQRFARPVLCTGLLGAYTTFSTLAVETALLAKDGHTAVAVAYVLASVIAGLLAIALGIATAALVLTAERRIIEARS